MIETTEVALARAEEVLDRYTNTGNPRLSATASFRGLNNASDELILGLKELAGQIRHAAPDPCLLQLFHA